MLCLNADLTQAAEHAKQSRQCALCLASEITQLRCNKEEEANESKDGAAKGYLVVKQLIDAALHAGCIKLHVLQLPASILQKKVDSSVISYMHMHGELQEL